jgi:hypothetical protein
METEDSLQSSQQPLLGPYTDPDESSPKLCALFPSDPFKYFISFWALFLSGFPVKLLYAFLLS